MPFVKASFLEAEWSLCSVVQSCPTLCDFMNCSLPDSSVHEIFQARTEVGCHFLLQETVVCLRINLISQTARSHHPEPCISGWVLVGNAFYDGILTSAAGPSWPYVGLSPLNHLFIVFTPSPKQFPNRNSLLKKLQLVLEKNCSPHKTECSEVMLLSHDAARTVEFAYNCALILVLKTTAWITSNLKRTPVPESRWRRGQDGDFVV